LADAALAAKVNSRAGSRRWTTGHERSFGASTGAAGQDCLPPFAFARWTSAAAETWLWCSRDATVSCAQEPDLHCRPAPTQASDGSRPERTGSPDPVPSLGGVRCGRWKRWKVTARLQKPPGNVRAG